MLRRMACLSALLTFLVLAVVAFFGWQGWQWISARQQTDQRLTSLADAWAASPQSLKAARGGVGDVRPPGVDAAPWSVPQATLSPDWYREASAKKLTVNYYARKGCDPVVDVKETPDIVVIALRCEVSFNPIEVARQVLPHDSSGSAPIEATTVTLTAALGPRIVVDASDGASLGRTRSE